MQVPDPFWPSRCHFCISSRSSFLWIIVSNRLTSAAFLQFLHFETSLDVESNSFHCYFFPVDVLCDSHILLSSNRKKKGGGDNFLVRALLPQLLVALGLRDQRELGAGRNSCYGGKRVSAVGSVTCRVTAVTWKRLSEQNQSVGFLTPARSKILLLVLFSLLSLEFCFMTNRCFTREDERVVGIWVVIYLHFVGEKQLVMNRTTWSGKLLGVFCSTFLLWSHPKSFM